MWVECILKECCNETSFGSIVCIMMKYLLKVFNLWNQITSIIVFGVKLENNNITIFKFKRCHEVGCKFIHTYVYI